MPVEHTWSAVAGIGALLLFLTAAGMAFGFLNPALLGTWDDVSLGFAGFLVSAAAVGIYVVEERGARRRRRGSD